MKKTLQLLLLLLIFSGFNIYGQSYTVTRGLALAEITTPTTGVTTITTLADDNSSAVQNIGFTFSFYGNNYTQFFIGSNGVIAFGSPQSGGYGNPLPTFQNYNTITFAGADLNCNLSSSPSALINTFTTGVSPNRILVVNFKNVRTYSNNPNFSNVQIQLFEGSNNIELHIGNVQSQPGGINRCIGVCDSGGSNFTTQSSINGVNSVNVVNERIRFNYIAPCANTLTLSNSATNICPPSNVVLTANVGNPSGIQYEWYRAGFLISGATSNTITLSDKEDYGSYYVKIKDPVVGCTKSSASQFIGSTIMNYITANVSSTNICSGTAITLNASSGFSGSGVTYSWSGPNGFSSTVSNPTVTVTAVTEGLYTLSATLAGCGTGTISRNIKSITPVVTASSSVSNGACESNTGSFSLFANLNGSSFNNPISPTVASYSWTGPNGFSSTVRNPVITPMTIAKSGVYTLTVTLSGGCNEVITKQVGVKIVATPDPSISFSPITGNYCANDSITLFQNNSISLGSTTITFLWTMPDGSTSTATNPRIKINEGGTYYLTTTYTGGCTGSVTRNVTVFPSTSPGTGFSTQNTCVGQNYTFTSFSNPASNSYVWAGPGGYTSNSANPNIPNVTTSNGGIYTAVVTSPTCPNSSTINVTLNVAPTCSSPTCSSYIFAGSYFGNTRCSGSNTYLGAFISNKVPGTTYSWSGPTSFTANSAEVIFNNLQASQFGTYTCVVVVPYGLCAGTQTLTYNLSANPNNDIKINPIANITSCEGGFVGSSIISNQSNIEYIEITGPNGYYNYQNMTFNTNNHYNTISNTIQTTQGGTYVINATLKPTCPSNPNETVNGTTSYTVTVVPRPVTPSISASPTNISVGQTSTLSNANSCTGTLIWQVGLGSGATKVVSPTVTKSYWAYCFNSTPIGCSSLGSNRVTVTVGTPCSASLTLVSTTDDISSGTTTKEANATTGTITATNKISGTAKVTYRAGKSISLNAGFKADNGTVFKTEFGGCN
jgi:trimeric autotransporter adhesin